MPLPRSVLSIVIQRPVSLNVFICKHYEVAVKSRDEEYKYPVEHLVHGGHLINGSFCFTINTISCLHHRDCVSLGRQTDKYFNTQTLLKLKKGLLIHAWDGWEAFVEKTRKLGLED